MSRAPPTSRDVRCGVCGLAADGATGPSGAAGYVVRCCVWLESDPCVVSSAAGLAPRCRGPSSSWPSMPSCRRAVVPSCRVVQSCRLRFASGTPAEGNRRPAAGGQTSGQPRPGAAQARAEVRRRAGPGGRRTCPSAPPSAPCTSSSPPDQHSPQPAVLKQPKEATRPRSEAS